MNGISNDCVSRPLEHANQIDMTSVTTRHLVHRILANCKIAGIIVAVLVLAWCVTQVSVRPISQESHGLLWWESPANREVVRRYNLSGELRHKPELALSNLNYVVSWSR